VILKGNNYIQSIFDLCELILNPLWGRIDRVLSFLPQECRSVQSRSHYRNCIRWICGVYYRIEHFLAEKEQRDVYEEWELAEDLQDFTRNVIYGYVVEKSSARVELQLDQLDSAILGGNRHRFRRMYFNLIMNAVDAMVGRRVGVINISARLEGEYVALRVRDNGCGMPPEKIEQLLTDKKSLDGELHSLGFVFVRQTVGDFEGELSVDSEVGRGTTITIRLPTRPEGTPIPRPISRCERFDLLQEDDRVRPGLRSVQAAGGEGVAAVKPPAADERNADCGREILHDYRTSDAPYPGSIFAIAVTEQDRIEFFTHRPYERLWNISHEDLSPMFFEATVRGRLEEDDEKNPVLILKAPQNVREYFEFKEVPEKERAAERYVQMMHDEYVRIARKLIETGMEPGIGVHLTDAQKFFAGRKELIEVEPFPLEDLARQVLTSEGEGPGA
jgi:hypothetical protein